MLVTATLPASLAVSVVAITVVADSTIQLELTSSRPAVPCPECGREASRVHSRYRRTIADLPWQGVAVRLHVEARRFFCDRPACPRQIFAERFPGFVSPHGRQTERLCTLFTAIALALGGEAGARLLVQLGIRRSPDSLLTSIRTASQPAPPAPRVRGIDDWSWRRGRRFGTILIDVDRHTVVDLLPDRKVESVVAWLQTQPQIEVIARDRAAFYSEAAAKGAPQALQVVDRRHLLHNLADAVWRCCSSISRCCGPQWTPRSRPIHRRRFHPCCPTRRRARSPRTARAGGSSARPRSFSSSMTAWLSNTRRSTSSWRPV